MDVVIIGLLGVVILFQLLFILKLSKVKGNRTLQYKEIVEPVTQVILNSQSHLQTTQLEQFGIISQNINGIIDKNIDKINTTLENKIKDLQENNEKKLTEMQKIVDEKLETTLNTRLTESFKTVSENLNSVQRGLGEMKNLAVDVGGLKRALTNVKTRGIFGEVQLERILDSLLTLDQYEKNVITKKNTRNSVEFALKLPGKDDGKPIYLPIDAKFPIEDYDALLRGYEAGDKLQIETSKKALSTKIDRFAKDIHDKYIDPPYTTDFAIMFLPTEGLYAEVVQNTELFTDLHNKYKVTVTGPTTLSAFLNALEMGFSTLEIEKKSTEVWNVLAEVKTEFNKFATALETTHKKVRAADEEFEKLLGPRKNVMQRKLRLIPEMTSAGNTTISEYDELLEEE